MPNIQEITERLDKLYWTDIQGYFDYLSRVKATGYKVLRNSKGKHRVESGFGEAFDKIFGGFK